VPIFFHQKNYKAKTTNRENLHKTLMYKKAARKMLMKLTPKDNFTNIIPAAFLTIFFTKKLQSKTIIRAAQKTFVQKSCS